MTDNGVTPPPPITGPSPALQQLGNKFVSHYYDLLHKSPDHVHRYYQEESSLGRPQRPEPGSSTIFVTTLGKINQMIIDWSDYAEEITKVETKSFIEGEVLVFLTGYLTAKDKVRRKFFQFFCLTKEDDGYTIKEDVVRYVTEDEVWGGCAPINPSPFSSLDELLGAQGVPYAG